MSTEQNKAVVRRFIEEVLIGQNAALVDELLAPDYVNHMVPGGREAFKQFFTVLSSAFPDLELHYSVDHLIAEGDYVVARITFHVANAGKEATGSDLSEYRVVNGQIVEDWPPSSTAALLEQVGVAIPTPA
jgi:predicted SnoaL-like aldol condensation-catalyzing enzyme